MSQSYKAYTAALVANLIFGSSYAAVKFITPGFIHPFALNFVRVAVTLSLFWILFLFKPGKVKFDRKDLPRFLICALTGIVINQLFFIKGVSLTTVIHSSLLSLGSPIFITIIAAWLLKEGFTILKAIGLACGVGGASILILMKDQSGAASNMVLGDILVLTNAISYAFYLVLVRPLMAKYSGIQVLRWIFTLGAIGILPIGLPYMLSTNWNSFDIAHWTVLAYVAVFSTFVAYLLTVQSIQLIGSSATGAFIYTQPVFAAIFAMLFTGEYFTLYKLVAAILIFTGVYLVNSKKLIKPA
ncbi:DMT family transporter [Sediminibacterium sp.]|uniref:DMT family transporter n=1 Tax=Sediminibacterium sp. TaxID=1917865 RepID=UPI0027330730|nr:DMT family transporter [Sediminibacterium sp.]MDP3394450.1 DMT family transporter [Sediminibacterium sp.]MDP3568285.1 DMT family transporter [Sediminibacterium sp.]